MYGAGLPAQYPGAFPQGNFGGFSNFNMPFPNGNMMPGNVFPPAGFIPPPVTMPNPFRPDFDRPVPYAGNGFANQPYPFNGGLQPPFVAPNANYFGSGSYNRPRSRHRSHSRGRRHRSNSRSSSSDDEYHRGHGSPFAGPGAPYYNMQPYPNVAPPIQPRAGSPLMFQRAGSPLLFQRPGSPMMPQQGPFW